MSYLNFRKEILKLTDNRVHKVTNSLGVYDAYKYYRKHRPKESKYVLKESQYFSIIRRVNEHLSELLIEGNDIILPLNMGQIELRKFTPVIKFEDGKVKTNLPIDWPETLKLWRSEERRVWQEV